MSRKLLTAEELQDGLRGLDPGWSQAGNALVRTVEFDSFLTAVRFIGELAPVAERLDHHPDLRLSWRTVEVSLSTHSAGGLTELDLRLARELDAIIDQLR
ncbi:MAG TPA: 4a-hydroxytetrahydrobiopterin dehydratase [Jatrophihabitans sp.]|jgi:4a-hydroxytetrahydrobiopterin dehydratase|uniref:4a-hydroxytetrahydrobiopterin dehydratase n=1 Tax=Jatrophihabitans sp. TaxID=1932789 RepID=UPI002EDC28C0